MAGIYIHIPFCVRKCCYCDFVSFPEDNNMQQYVDALLREIRLSASALPMPTSVDTVFLGGGTPSLLLGEQLAAILDTVRHYYPISADAEVSLECNPGTVTLEKLKQYRCAGVNRLSIGAQSMEASLLSIIGRIHTREQIVDTVRFAHQAGFSNINVDVMHGLPTQSMQQYLRTLSDLIELGITHVSAYSLILEEGTPLYRAVCAGEISVPETDAVADMQDAGIDYLQENSFHRYEISNFALDGFTCRHNLNYWDNGEYLGFGLAAHGVLRVPEKRRPARWTRFENTTDLKRYFSLLSSGKLPNAHVIRLYPADEMFESIMLGLRKVEGIHKDGFLSRYGITIRDAYPQACRTLFEKGWLAETETHFALNAKGLDLQNAALQFFM